MVFKNKDQQIGSHSNAPLFYISVCSQQCFGKGEMGGCGREIIRFVCLKWDPSIHCNCGHVSSVPKWALEGCTPFSLRGNLSQRYFHQEICNSLGTCWSSVVGRVRAGCGVRLWVVCWCSGSKTDDSLGRVMMPWLYCWYDTYGPWFSAQQTDVGTI